MTNDRERLSLSRRVLLTGLLAAAAAPACAADKLERFRTARGGSKAVDHGAFDRLLGRYVRAGADGVNRVDYGAWKASAADRGALGGYIAALEQTDPTTLGRAEQFAYWANLYNAATLRVVLDRYPVRSIKEIKPNLIAIGPWKTAVVTVGGTALSLDEIEHGILRRGWREPRVHYAVNCASYGCPNLRLRAIRGGTLEADLADAARDYVNHPRAARVEGGKLIVSSIYDWYKADFGGSDSGVIAHLRQHASPRLKSELAGVKSVAKHAYDWALNDTARR
jgi:hypothetical protein